jgi:hypothetical protein
MSYGVRGFLLDQYRDITRGETHRTTSWPGRAVIDTAERTWDGRCLVRTPDLGAGGGVVSANVVLIGVGHQLWARLANARQAAVS